MVEPTNLPTLRGAFEPCLGRGHGVGQPLHWQLFERRRRDTEVEKHTDRSPVEQVDWRERLCCAICAAAITATSSALERDGRHEHYFTNPHGIGYRIGCFADAVGVTALGSETAENTWFAGYRWRIMLCAQCNTLLGWRFRSPSDEFFGLIVAHLSPCRNTGPA